MPTRHGYAVLVCVITSLYLNGFAAMPVYADESTLTEQHFFPDIPVVLSATRLPQSVEDSPVAVTVITREMIEASGATEIPDLLRLAPGFLVDYDNAHVAAASYHILPDRFVRQQQVLIDGRSVYDPLLGGVPWMELPITVNEIERIEVIRGPDAAAYGSNSFMGVINIITRSAILDKGTTIQASVGTDKLKEGFARYGDSNGTVDYRINMAYRSDDGFDNRNDGKIVRLLNSRVDYQVNDKDNMTFEAGYSAGPRQMDDSFDTGIPYHDMHTYSQFQQIKWQHVNAPEDVYSLQIYHNQLSENDSYLRTDVPIWFDTSTTTDRYDLEIQKIKRLNESLRYVIGAGYRLDQVKGQLYFGTPDTLDNHISRLFTHGEYRYNKDLLFNLGLMLEDNDITGSDLSPQVSANYKLTPEDTLRVAVSKGTRTPVLAEQYVNTAINLPGYYDQIYFNNGQINNERMTEYDIGFVGHRNQNNFTYDVKFFYEDLSGLINGQVVSPYPDVDNKAIYFTNIDSAIIRGFESGIDWNLTNATKIHFAYSHIYISSADVSEDYSNSAPSSLASLLATHNFRNGYIGSLFVYSRSSMKPLARHAYDPAYMAPYTRVDLRLAKNFRVGETSQQIAIAIRNLFNAYQYSTLQNNVDQAVYFSYRIGFR